LATACAQLYAVDLSHKMLQIAARAASLPHGGYICADSLRLPLPDHAVDLVFASCLLHHMSEVPPAVVVTELSRICRPGGLVVCFEHNPLNPVTQLVVRTTPIDHTAVLLPAKTLRQAFRCAGLQDVDCRFILFGPKPIDRQLMRWRPWLYRVSLGAQYLVYGRKGNGCHAARPA
jgi:ubiquinone/menaquinone biosynthesis C-methylase UbiE